MSDNAQTNTQQDENRLIAERREKLAAQREQGNAFPNTFRRDAYAGDLQKTHGEKSKEELAEAGIKVSVAGRIMLNRGAFMVPGPLNSCPLSLCLSSFFKGGGGPCPSPKP